MLLIFITIFTTSGKIRTISMNCFSNRASLFTLWRRLRGDKYGGGGIVSINNGWAVQNFGITGCWVRYQYRNHYGKYYLLDLSYKHQFRLNRNISNENHTFKRKKRALNLIRRSMSYKNIALSSNLYNEIKTQNCGLWIAQGNKHAPRKITSAFEAHYHKNLL